MGTQRQGDKGPEFTLAEIVQGETAFCLREGENLHIIREHMTPTDAVQMYKDVMEGKITQDDLVTKYQWRTMNMREAGFKGAERVQLPPLDRWPK